MSERVRFRDGAIIVTQVNYRGYEIHTYLSPRHYERYIYKEGEVLDTVYETTDRSVTVDDCRRIVDRLTDKPEQLRLEL